MQNVSEDVLEVQGHDFRTDRDRALKMRRVRGTLSERDRWKEQRPCARRYPLSDPRYDDRIRPQGIVGPVKLQASQRQDAYRMARDCLGHFESDHFLVYTQSYEEDSTYIIAPPSLRGNPNAISRLLTQAFHQ